jgi:TniQ protein
LLLGAVEREAFGGRAVGSAIPATRLLDPIVADHLAVLGQLSDPEITGLWPARSDWELHDLTFSTFCPHCCLGDLGSNRTPYGRQAWQQSWCTVCLSHGTALMARNVSHAPRNRSSWSRAQLRSEGQFVAANRYRDLKVPSQPEVRSTVLGCLLEIERATAAAISGIAPKPCSWGSLTPQEFLRVLQDVTTWALTHFEPVRCWSVAEDFTPTERMLTCSAHH